MAADLVKDWTGKFFGRHLARYPHERWPDLASKADFVFWQNWRQALIDNGVTEAEAEAASVGMALRPPRWPSEHPEALWDAVLLARGRSGPPDLEAARARSLGCPDCGGEPPAAAVRWSHAHGHPNFGRSASFRCSCPLGRFLHDLDPDLMPPLWDFPHLMLGPCTWTEQPDNPQRYRPEAWDFAAGRPRPLPTHNHSRLERPPLPRRPAGPVGPPPPEIAARMVADMERSRARAALRADAAQVAPPPPHKKPDHPVHPSVDILTDNAR